MSTNITTPIFNGTNLNIPQEVLAHSADTALMRYRNISRNYDDLYDGFQESMQEKLGIDKYFWRRVVKDITKLSVPIANKYGFSKNQKEALAPRLGIWVRCIIIGRIAEQMVLSNHSKKGILDVLKDEYVIETINHMLVLLPIPTRLYLKYVITFLIHDKINEYHFIGYHNANATCVYGEHLDSRTKHVIREIENQMKNKTVRPIVIYRGNCELRGLIGLCNSHISMCIEAGPYTNMDKVKEIFDEYQYIDKILYISDKTSLH